MKTLEEKAKEYAENAYIVFPQSAVKSAFIAGYKAAFEWISVEKNKPLAYIRGHWDGLKSDEILVKTKQGKIYVAVLYSGFMDGSEFNDFYESNGDYEINEVIEWRPINND